MYHRGLSCLCVSIADEQLSLLSILPDSHMSHKDISNPLVAIADVWLRIHTITKLINRLWPIVHHHQAATKGTQESMGGFILLCLVLKCDYITHVHNKIILGSEECFTKITVISTFLYGHHERTCILHHLKDSFFGKIFSWLWRFS